MAEHRRGIERALRRWPVDVVPMHDIDFDHYLPPPGPEEFAEFCAAMTCGSSAGSATQPRLPRARVA